MLLNTSTLAPGSVPATRCPSCTTIVARESLRRLERLRVL